MEKHPGNEREPDIEIEKKKASSHKDAEERQDELERSWKRNSLFDFQGSGPWKKSPGV